MTAVHIAAGPRNGIFALRQFVRSKPVERCEFCGTPIAAEHGHLFEPASRRVSCTCRVCGDALSGRPDHAYRLVPRDTRALLDFRISDAEWHALGVPVEMAFVFHSTPEGRPVALYPGPTGVTEALIGPEAWAHLVARNPVLAEFEPDVEALLVNRVKGRRAYYRVPIDRCFALVGLIRKLWRGFNGGDEVWAAIDDFFARLGEPAGAGASGAT